MFIVALLIAGVSAEWVEISQNNYRQEPPRLKENVDLDSKDLTYVNQSLNQWKRGSINKISHIGNVRRVPYASVKTPSVKPNFESLESRPVVWKGSRTKITPHSLEDSERKEHRVHLKGDNQNSIKIKINSYINRPVESQVKNSAHKVNDLRSPDRVDINAETGGFQRVSIEEVFQSSSNRNDILSSEDPSVKMTKDDKKQKPLTDKPVTEDWMNTSVSADNKMERVWEAVKLVADTISKKTHRGFKSKVRYLEDLKDTITASIEGHIDRLWPDDEDSGRSRRSTESRGHVEVPSSEGALMTISFLTFAVFLIKLVLQVIHAYKQKGMMVTPAVLAAVGRTSGSLMKNLS
ncbi:uncharacterized protein LOC125054824 [Pieris napi]|uniref:uncharacterized protein LOC125054824 n=1 Tax=Pieris napi TaxID=78633 RepID=UPI001FB8D7EC|nr:uncharacterized protein LOC125054824 [Pieris napi]